MKTNIANKEPLATAQAQTPGPWLAVMKKDKPSGLSGDTGVERWSVTGKNSLTPLATVRICMENAQGRVNAHLMAAAPELYEACKNISWLISELQMFKNRPEFVNALKQVTSAINKAEG